MERDAEVTEGSLVKTLWEDRAQAGNRKSIILTSNAWNAHRNWIILAKNSEVIASSKYLHSPGTLFENKVTTNFYGTGISGRTKSFFVTIKHHKLLIWHLLDWSALKFFQPFRRLAFCISFSLPYIFHKNMISST